MISRIAGKKTLKAADTNDVAHVATMRMLVNLKAQTNIAE